MIQLRKYGKIIPDRENDELTYALGNPEKVGRTRFFGPSVPWKTGFLADIDTYRSRSRKTNRQKAEEAVRLEAVEKRNEEFQSMFKLQQEQINELRVLARQQDPALDSPVGPS